MSTARYDVENLLSDIKQFLVDGLNDKIDAVEAEKIAVGAVATNLAHVDVDKGYFEQSWSDNILNISPAIFFGIEDIKASGVGPATAEVYKIFVEVILVDSGQDQLAKNRINRYSRAIKEVLEANYDKLSSSSQIKIETVRPTSFKIDLNSSEEIKVGGVSLITALA